MNSYARLVRSEVRKLLTTFNFLGALAISVGLTVFSIVVDAAVAGKHGQPRLGTTADVHQMLKFAPVPCIAMLVVGMLATGSESRHHTIISTALAEPRRSLIVWAKATTLLLAGATLSSLTSAIGLASVY